MASQFYKRQEKATWEHPKNARHIPQLRQDTAARCVTSVRAESLDIVGQHTTILAGRYNIRDLKTPYRVGIVTYLVGFLIPVMRCVMCGKTFPKFFKTLLRHSHFLYGGHRSVHTGLEMARLQTVLNSASGVPIHIVV